MAMVKINLLNSKVVIIHHGRREYPSVTLRSERRLRRVTKGWDYERIGDAQFFEAGRKPVQPEPEPEERLIRLDVDVYVPAHEYRQWQRGLGCLR